jgi:uncharacterized protein (DUF169 family)
MSNADLATTIRSSLGLDLPPVSLTFVDEAPQGMPGPPRVVPSACSFWRDAEQGTFFAPAGDHYNCLIGTMVMGFEIPPERQGDLGTLVETMCGHSYIGADEPAAIPTVKTPHAGIVYGPLADATATPDVVLIWVTARQAMLCNEAMGTASWTAGSPTTTGRPGCAALPLAMSERAPSISLGCAGMRRFTGIDDGRLLVAVPGNEVESFAAALQEIARANATMDEFYAGQQAAVAGGVVPEPGGPAAPSTVS